jgi:hypothetical protein
MGEFAVGVRILRVNDWSYMAGWSWLNYWPNFLQGMNHSLHAWKVNNHPDRRDGIDGWNSPIVRFTRQSLDPYLVQDLEILRQNAGEPRLLPDGQIEWPLKKPTCAAGVPTERLLEVFNGALEGNKLTLRWSLHWDKPDGPAEAQGGEIACTIEPGFHATEKISFTPSNPGNGRTSRSLYLVLESLKDGRTVFRDDNLCFECLAIPSANAEPNTSGERTDSICKLIRDLRDKPEARLRSTLQLQDEEYYLK